MRIEGTQIRKFFAGFAERSPDGSLKFYHGDHLGSASLVTSSAGAMIRRQAYMPYGEDRFVDDRTAGSFAPRYQFNFKEKESTGFYDYGALLYNPGTGRWLLADSVTVDGVNRCAYAVNNPLKYVDPTGHFVLPSFFLQQKDPLRVGSLGEVTIHAGTFNSIANPQTSRFLSYLASHIDDDGVVTMRRPTKNGWWPSYEYYKISAVEYVSDPAVFNGAGIAHVMALLMGLLTCASRIALYRLVQPLSTRSLSQHFLRGWA